MMKTNSACLKKYRITETTKTAIKVRLKQYLQHGKDLLKHWQMNRRSRHQLAQMNSYQLKDIGVSPGEAQEETNKPFWRD